VKSSAANVEVPILLLCGDWLKAVGFPIGSAAYLTTDAQGELALHRMGLRMPKRLYIRRRRVDSPSSASSSSTVGCSPPYEPDGELCNRLNQ
jgi:hypothetical protein